MFGKRMKSKRNRLLAALASVLFVLGLGACSTADEQIAVGDPAPEFSLPTAQGGQVSLADYRDQRPVLLYFHMAVG